MRVRGDRRSAVWAACWAMAWLAMAAMPAAAVTKAGAARVSITPDPARIHYPLGGYVAPERLKHNATGVHDTCYARALVLQYGATKVALVSLDLCFMPANVKTAVMARIGATHIPASGVFIATTHTHSAPDPLTLHSGNTENLGKLPTFEPRLLNWFAERIARAIVEANSRLRPAFIGSGQAQQIGLNRNRRGEQLTDDEMTLLKVTDTRGKPLAMVVDYAAHPTYYGVAMLQVSGDWAGAFERALEQTYPGSVALFINGAEGDASPAGADEGTPAARIKTYTAKLLVKTRDLYRLVAPMPDADIAAWSQPVELPAPRPHNLFLLAGLQFGAKPEQTRAYVRRMMPSRTALSFLRVGDALLMGFPGEPTAAIGLEAKSDARQAGVKYPAVVALTNGWLGYLVTADQYRAGKYEASMSFYGETIGQTMLAGVRAGLDKRR